MTARTPPHPDSARRIFAMRTLALAARSTGGSPRRWPQWLQKEESGFSGWPQETHSAGCGTSAGSGTRSGGTATLALPVGGGNRREQAHDDEALDEDPLEQRLRLQHPAHEGDGHV